MSRRTPGAAVVMAVVAAVASWTSLLAWGGFVVDRSSYLVPAAVGIAAVTVAGVLARAARLPALVVVAGQLLVVMVAGNLVWGSSPLPTPESLRTAVQALRIAVDTSQQYAAPVPADVPSVVPLLVLGALALHVLVDLLAATLGRAPVAGLPLLTIYSLPVSVLDGGVSWVVFAVGAACFLVMIALQERDRLSRWGRQVTPAPTVSPHHAGGAMMAVSTIALALVLPFVVPTFDLGLLERLQAGPGSGGDGEVRIENPMTDMKRDLVLGPDRPLLQVSGTADEAPSYVRIAVLTTFTGQAWTPGDRDLPEEHAATGEVPPPIGLAEDVPRERREWTYRATRELDSKWLPAPRFPGAVMAGELWRYDDEVLDFHAADDDVTTADTSWSAVALDLDLGARDLNSAGPAPDGLSSSYTELPEDFPRSVSALAERVTEGTTTDYERAARLQDFFQSEFTYDVTRRPGNGNDALVQFLSEEDRRGYCEQFASAMAVMLRAADVPARVSVGLLRPDLVGDSYEFSSRDMHAWPEVYLEGYGWVMFEPTPVAHTRAVPDYSRGIRPDEPDEPRTDGRGETASPSASPLVSPSASPSAAAPGQQDDAGAGADAGFPWTTVLLWSLLTLVVLTGLGLLPHLFRSRRRARRWHGPLPPAEAAWAELRDRVVDLGLGWPHGRSPRRTAAILSTHLAAPRTAGSPQRPPKGATVAPEAAEALHGLAGAVEETRYAPAGTADHDVADLRTRVETVGASLEAGATPGRRRAARWWPRSLVQRSPAEHTDDLVDSLD